MTTGIDYAWGRPRPSAIGGAGHRFVCRYLSHTPSKNLTASEATELLTAGLDVVMVWESTAQRPLGGIPAGVADGRSARSQADAIGAPKTAAIYFAVDFEAQPASFDTIAAYLKAAAAECAPRPVGVYGSANVCNGMATRRAASFFWQTAAWSYRKRSPVANLYQHAAPCTVDGVSCDLNEAITAEFGQWHATAPIPQGDGDLTPNEHETLQQTHDAVARFENTIQWLENLVGEIYAQVTGNPPPAQP